MGLAGFNRSRRRLAEEHKKRVEAQKIIKPSVAKTTKKIDVKKAVKKIKKEIKEIKTDDKFEPLPEVTEENKEDIKTFEPEIN